MLNPFQINFAESSIKMLPFQKIFVGAYFSKIAYEEHEKLGHSELKGHKGMDHGTLEIAKNQLVPEITDFKVIKDSISGWNVYFQVKNFRFAPEHAFQSPQEGEGHAHLYINGNKIARLYGNWYHIPEMIKDKNEIKVTLNSNDHQTLTIDGQAIEKIVMK